MTNEKKELMNRFKDLVLSEAKKGNVVLATPEGLKGTSLDDLINQPVEGILYDLNRDAATILTFIEDVKWINDYACAQVIRKLKTQHDLRIKQNCENLKNKIDLKELENNITQKVNQVRNCTISTDEAIESIMEYITDNIDKDEISNKCEGCLYYSVGRCLKKKCKCK